MTTQQLHDLRSAISSIMMATDALEREPNKLIFFAMIKRHAKAMLAVLEKDEDTTNGDPNVITAH